MLKCSIIYKPPSVWKQFYTSLIRPHLEYAVQAWKPTQLGDIDRLEKIQKRALRVTHQLRGLTYEERLESMELTNLEMRRGRGDLIQAYKILNGIELVRQECMPKYAPSRNSSGPASRTRGNSQKLQRQDFRSRIKNDFGGAVESRHNFFSNRVVPLWNGLPDDVVRAPNLNGFKARLDSFMSKPRVMSGAATAGYSRIPYSCE